MSLPMWRLSGRHRSSSRRLESTFRTAAPVVPVGRGRAVGQSVVEFALILPIFLILIAGAIDLGRLFYAYVAITNASKEGALYGASNPLCDDARPTARTH